ncbi:MAG: ATP-binding protein [Actinomycetota bacterium]
MLVLAGVFVYLRVATNLSEAIDNGLRSRADSLAGFVASSEGPPRLGGGRFIENEEGFSQVLTPRGRVVASTLEDGVGPVLDPEQVARARSAPLRVDNREVPGIEGSARILARPASSPDGKMIVVAGASTDDRRETLASLRKAFLIGAPVALLLASGLGYLLARRSLAPVEVMRRRADEITLERSGERLPLPEADDEIRQLGETLNRMLDRIEASLKRERVFVADASHELRTPLAILRTELELADRSGRSPEQVLEALRSARDEVDRLSRLADDLLVIAKSDHGELAIARERVELQNLLDRVRRRFDGRARESGREIEISAPDGGGAELDPLRIEQALGNLVDNALRHGKGRVRLSAARDGNGVSFEVSDEGSGFAPGFEAKAFERFARADEGRTGGGAGLGLAIAQAIATSHGGRVSVESRPGDSTTVLRITLPAEAPEHEKAPR